MSVFGGGQTATKSCERMAPGDWTTVTIREKKPANFGNVPGTARAATDKVVSTTAGDSGVVPSATGDVSEETAPDRGSDREH